MASYSELQKILISKDHSHFTKVQLAQAWVLDAMEEAVGGGIESGKEGGDKVQGKSAKRTKKTPIRVDR